MTLIKIELLVAYFSIFTSVHASKILFLLPIASKSHYNVFDPLINALAQRNHELTIVSPYKTNKYPLLSVKEIVPVGDEALSKCLDNPIKMRQKRKFTLVTSFNSTHIETACHQLYQNKEVQNMLDKDTFDLIILNGFGNSCAYGIIGHFKVPYILMFTMAAPASVVATVGNHFPPSFVPSSFINSTDRMNFFERAQNLVMHALFGAISDYKFQTPAQNVYQTYLPYVPSIREISKNLSMIFMNSHFTLNYARPLLPNVIEVGGMHCRPAQPLPQDLDKFLSGAEDGFILFSLGSIVKSNILPEETRKVFINVFSRLKQRVIWKWDDEEMKDLPSNVIIRKWLPQQDILGHKKIRLFMTHGGLLSTQEAIYHSVPLLGIPIFGDQNINTKQAEKVGISLNVEIIGLTEEALESTIRCILDEPEFRKKAKDLSEIYKDQLQTPLDRAVYWTEYVIRYKGAPQLQSSGRDLNFWQYHSIDVIGFLMGVFLSVAWLIKFLTCNLLLKGIKMLVCRIIMCKNAFLKKRMSLHSPTKLVNR